jgi:DNA-binding NtrC family response regulator
VSTYVQDLSEIRDRIQSAGIALVGESSEFQRLLRSVERIARHAAATVLIRGETGTGKELIARAVHYLGQRRDFPFVPVNCGALPESLVENELFGHRAGAYTNAGRDAIGVVQLAHNGTLFLDEVDALPAKAQVALLRFLQDGSYRALGAAREERADVRIIAATNGQLEEGIRAGTFRSDLYYRLNLLSLEIPPLRTRLGDIRVLAQHFLRDCVNRYQLPRKTVDETTLRRFERYSWPGNVRELENLVQRECLLSEKEELDINVPEAVSTAPSNTGTLAAEAANLTYRVAKSRVLEEFDRRYLLALLQRTGGNVTRAAALAGKERRAFGKLLKRYQLSQQTGGAQQEPRALITNPTQRA